MVRITPDYSSRPERSRRDLALEDPELALVLKDLAERIIPEKLEQDFRRLVETGAIDPLMSSETQPVFSPVSQVMGLPRDEADRWLKILFGKDPSLMAKAQCPCYGFRNGRFSTDPNFYDSYYGNQLETPSLLSVLGARSEAPAVELASLHPALLAEKLPDRYGNMPEETVLHQMLQTREFSVATFDRLEKITGGTDFLLQKNARGETLFHRIASNPAWGEDMTKLDVASWMLQRRPELVNECDRFGWTPLDRLVSLSQGKYDTSMGRLLVVSGARLEKQLVPKFNLEAELEARSDARLGKPVPKAKASVLSKGL